MRLLDYVNISKEIKVIINMNILSLSVFNSTVWIVIIATAVIIFFVVLFLSNKKHQPLHPTDKFEDLFLKIREEIKHTVTPKFIDISLSAGDLIDLAVDVWRIEQRISKLAPNLHEQQFKGIDSSIQKFKRFLSKYDIEILDYKDQKYNEGLNLDILSIEKDPSLLEPKIKEIIEPTIMCKGQVVRTAKVILLSNN